MRQRETGIQLSPNSDITTMMMFAEYYNETGYYKHHNTPTPYVYSGTNVYKKGKYISDKVYNPEAIDKQPGVYMLVMSILGT